MFDEASPIRQPVRTSATCLVLAVIVGGAPALAAPTSRPATAPVTGPPQPDLSSPRSTLAAWLRAVNEHDLATLDRILIDAPAQRQVVADLLSFSRAVKRLEAAAVARFGDKGKEVTGYPSQPPEAAADAEITAGEDWAEAELPEAAFPLRMRRIDGQWRVDMSRAMKNRSFVRAVQASRRAADVAEQVASEVAAGEYRTVEEAREAFTRRRLAAVRAPAEPRE